MSKRYIPTPWQFRWFMRMWPPLLANGIRATHVSPDFRTVTVRIAKQKINTNFNGGIWGGAMLAAADPWHGMMYYVCLNKLGIDAKVASTEVKAEFIRTARTSLSFTCTLSEQDIADCVAAFERGEKFIRTHPIEGRDKDGEVCFRAEVTLYMRKLDKPLRMPFL